MRRAASVSLMAAGDPFQRVHTQSLAQVLCRFVQQRQGLQRSLIALVSYPLAPFLVDLHVRLSAGTMVVQIRIQVLPIEVVDAVGVAGIDVSIADVFANDRAVLGLHQAVVAALPRPALGLLDAQFFQQLGDGFVDELAAVVGVEAQDAKRKLTQHVLQNRLQIGLRDARRCTGHLPLRDLIDGVDVINALLSAVRLIALMHRVQAQKSGLALRLRLAPLADRDRRGPRLGVVEKPLTIALVVAQVIQMSYGDRRQPRILRLACRTRYSRSRMRRVAGPLSVSCASSTEASNSMSARV